MNPFFAPDEILVSPRPQDMRAGIHSLGALVLAEFGHEPTDGRLYVFVSRDAKKCKMLRFDVSGWVLYYCTLSDGTFRWRHDPNGGEMLAIERRQLFWLLEGLEVDQPKAAKPVTATAIL